MSDAEPVENLPSQIYNTVEERSIIDVINARAVELVKLEDRLRNLQLFDTQDADGREIKRTKRLRSDSVDVQILLERIRRYYQAEKEAASAGEMMENADLNPQMRAIAMQKLALLRDQQSKELLALELHRAHMRKDYGTALQASIKMLGDAAFIRQREAFHRDEMEILKNKTVDVLSDAELERQADEHGQT